MKNVKRLARSSKPSKLADLPNSAQDTNQAGGAHNITMTISTFQKGRRSTHATRPRPSPGGQAGDPTIRQLADGKHSNSINKSVTRHADTSNQPNRSQTSLNARILLVRIAPNCRARNSDTKQTSRGGDGTRQLVSQLFMVTNTFCNRSSFINVLTKPNGLGPLGPSSRQSTNLAGSSETRVRSSM